MSWFEAARVLPIHVTQIGPEGYLCPSEVVAAMNNAAVGGISVSSTTEGVIDRGTDVLYTDCWPKNKDLETIKRQFLPYQITKKVVDKMNPKGFYMPCPPITRGEELSEDSLAAPQYCDYQAKEYLLHSQNAIMEFCLKGC
jgi:ornithine carbamoyltransferase